MALFPGGFPLNRPEDLCPQRATHTHTHPYVLVLEAKAGVDLSRDKVVCRGQSRGLNEAPEKEAQDWSDVDSGESSSAWTR